MHGHAARSTYTEARCAFLVADPGLLLAKAVHVMLGRMYWQHSVCSCKGRHAGRHACMQRGPFQHRAIQEGACARLQPEQRLRGGQQATQVHIAVLGAGD